MCSVDFHFGPSWSTSTSMYVTLDSCDQLRPDVYNCLYLIVVEVDTDVSNGLMSQPIRKTRHKSKFFAYDLDIYMKRGELSLVLPFRFIRNHSRMS